MQNLQKSYAVYKTNDAVQFHVSFPGSSALIPLPGVHTFDEAHQYVRTHYNALKSNHGMRNKLTTIAQKIGAEVRVTKDAGLVYYFFSKTGISPLKLVYEFGKYSNILNIGKMIDSGDASILSNGFLIMEKDFG